jgi:membrane protein required for colicin V production
VSKIDIVLVIIFLIGAFAGYRKGFLAELFSLIGIILGIFAGFKLMGVAMIKLADNYKVDEKILPYVAFGIVFFIVVILVSLLGKMLKSSLEKTVLGNADQVAGAGLGLLKAAFMASVFLWITSSVNLGIPETWSKDSWLYPFTASIAPEFTTWVAQVFPVFGDLFGDRS